MALIAIDPFSERAGDRNGSTPEPKLIKKAVRQLLRSKIGVTTSLNAFAIRSRISPASC